MSKLERNFSAPTKISQYAVELLRDHGASAVIAAGLRFRLVNASWLHGPIVRVEVVTEEGRVLSSVESPAMTDGDTFTVLDVHRLFEINIVVAE